MEWNSSFVLFCSAQTLLVLFCDNCLLSLSVTHIVENAVRPDSKPKLNEQIRATFLKRWSFGGDVSAGQVKMLYGNFSLGLSGNQAQHCSLGACWFVSNMAICSPVVNTDTFSLSSFTVWATRPVSHHLPSTSPSLLLSLLTLLNPMCSTCIWFYDWLHFHSKKNCT